MHPILADGRRFRMYLIGWLPIGLFVAAGIRQNADWTTTMAFVLPLVVVYAFIGLSTWYLCQTLPIDTAAHAWRALALHIIAAAITSGVWVTLAQGWAATLDSLNTGLTARQLDAAERWPLFVVGVLLFWLVTILQYLLLAFEASRAAETRALEMNLLAREAELKALRAQLDPHFLFNSLNSISSLTTTDPAAARRMCLLLGDFLRDTLRLGSSNRITLSDELDLAERFLAIERVRLGSRLSVQRDTDSRSQTCLVPPLLIQPLIENAVVHGVSHLVEGGTIRIAATRGDATLTISLENPCDPDRPRRRGKGFGLELLRQRVATHFGSDGVVHISEQPDRFRVEVRIPALTAA